MFLPKDKLKFNCGTKLCGATFQVFRRCLPCDSAPRGKRAVESLLLFIVLVVIFRIFLEACGIKGLKSETMERLPMARMLLQVSEVSML